MLQIPHAAQAAAPVPCPKGRQPDLGQRRWPLGGLPPPQHVLLVQVSVHVALPSPPEGHRIRAKGQLRHGGSPHTLPGLLLMLVVLLLVLRYQVGVLASAEQGGACAAGARVWFPGEG